MNKSKILIVDDELDICILLSGILKSFGYETQHALGVADGYLMYLTEHHPIAFIDLTMPDGSGFTLVNKIKNIHPETRIVIISAHDSDNDRRLATEQGASYFIGKPLSRQLVLDALKAVEKLNTN